MKSALKETCSTRLKNIDKCDEEEVYMGHHKTNVENTDKIKSSYM